MAHLSLRKHWDPEDVTWSWDDRTFMAWLATRHCFQLGLDLWIPLPHLIPHSFQICGVRHTHTLAACWLLGCSPVPSMRQHGWKSWDLVFLINTKKSPPSTPLLPLTHPPQFCSSRAPLSRNQVFSVGMYIMGFKMTAMRQIHHLGIVEVNFCPLCYMLITGLLKLFLFALSALTHYNSAVPEGKLLFRGRDQSKDWMFFVFHHPSPHSCKLNASSSSLPFSLLAGHCCPNKGSFVLLLPLPAHAWLPHCLLFSPLGDPAVSLLSCPVFWDRAAGVLYHLPGQRLGSASGPRLSGLFSKPAHFQSKSFEGYPPDLIWICSFNTLRCVTMWLSFHELLSIPPVMLPSTSQVSVGS